MGASQPQPAMVDPNFPMHNYLNQGLTRNQVLMIHAVFSSYHPQHGRIPSHKYRDSLLHSPLRDQADRQLAEREWLTFD